MSLREIAHQVAEHLPGFTARPYGNGAYLEGAEHCRLWISQEWNQRNRVTISGCYPHGFHPYFSEGSRFGAKEPRITVRSDRGGEAIAKEIKRRLLPKYLQILEMVLQGVEQHDTQVATARRRWDELNARFPVQPYGQDWNQDESALRGLVGSSYHGSHFNVTVYGTDEPCLKVEGRLTLEDGIALLDALQQTQGERHAL